MKIQKEKERESNSGEPYKNCIVFLQLHRISGQCVRHPKATEFGQQPTDRRPVEFGCCKGPQVTTAEAKAGTSQSHGQQKIHGRPHYAIGKLPESWSQCSRMGTACWELRIKKSRKKKK